MNALHTCHMRRRMVDLVQHVRFNAVQHPRHHRPRRLPDDAEDRHRDQQPDDRVGERKAHPDPERPQHHGKAGEAIGAGVIAVGDQRRRIDLASHPDAKHRHPFIGDKADDPRSGDPAQIADGFGVQQPLHGLPARDTGGKQDQSHDGQPRQIFGAAKAIGEGAAGFAAGEHEGEPQGDCRHCIAEVVDGVGQQRDAARKRHDGRLNQGSDEQHREGPFDGPDAPRGGGNRRVHHPVCMAVPAFLTAMAVAVACVAVPAAAIAEPFACLVQHHVLTGIWR